MLQTSESVGIGHPDKIADQIADSILDAAISIDKNSQVACEVLTSHNLIVVAGEVHTTANLDYESIIKELLTKLKYNLNDFKFILNISKQSLDIRNSVFSNKITGAGDQGIVYGYATNETPSYLPLSHVISSDLVKVATKLIDTNVIPWAKYDMKSLVSLRKKDTKYYLENLVFSIQHQEDIKYETLKEEILNKIIEPVLKKHGIDFITEKIYINSSGRFVLGGLEADSGLTNRKLMVDSYGSEAKHGGGGYSGKDLTKIDRLGAYYARWICKNLVASGICKFIELELVYYLGAKEAVSYSINVNDDCKYTKEEILEIIKNIFPKYISELIDRFNNGKFKYRDLACFGHFGNELYPWEKIDKKEEIEAWLKKR
ncbi:hypothetical protein A6V39_02200 [Candidatus Mycoplasma haematobovis]|uniref:Methionine adenosyltransferase n=1 Tax=Candidatus Mycoplasma haematobovis TaxID=432608 RepID=A0A1A9QCQ4_9MOLU|nr:methionine adenosyltransferase [Candidatus Mycoplasma haematobovis]OAL10233.1 hypothetical protein A6V39_02200 [Candidatus Mycoplasma haematobovis]